MDCEVHLVCTRQRAEHIARREDPDSPDVMTADMLHSLESALRMAEQMAHEAGFDIHQPLPSPPVALDAVRVHRAGVQVARALARMLVPVDVASEALTDAAGQAIALWSLLVAKAARVFSYTVEFDPDLWSQDAEPNLLLMQHVRCTFSGVLEQLRGELPEGSIPGEVQAGVDASDRLLMPLSDRVSAAARQRLEVFITHGVAPSPFCATLDRTRRI